MKLISIFFLLCLALHGSKSKEATKRKSYEELYVIAKNSYLANDWRNCITYMKASLAAFANHRRIVKDCRMGCDALEGTANANLSASLIGYDETMRFYETLINQTLCMMKCKRRKLGSYENPHPDPSIVREFNDRLTYDYLQSCYHKIDELKNAANAAFTHLALNHESTVMQDNLKFYMEKDTSLKYEELVNLETLSYVKSFREGIDAYEKKDFESVIRFFEIGVKEYLDAWRVCRLNCDKPFDMGWFPDFMTSTANHFTYCLRCKQKCVTQLANLDGEYYHDIFPLMYHHLQFAYYKKNDIRKSTEALESYLILYDSEEVSTNKKYFLDLPEIKATGEKEWFVPRKEALEYLEVIKRDNDLIQSIEDNFKFDDDPQDKDGPLPPETDSGKTEL
uniref:Cartilage-associated protein n=1 Tax=Caligus rogercresseyi TaxID=217165 RepID=C1BQ40_CALRO|nr:Cartilage-associated protein precursor [Caligus rogercresseyi]